MADFPRDKYTFDCKYVSFCIELITFIRLGIANSFLFLIFPCCYFYVMSRSTFPDQIRPRPLIACLNCASSSQQLTIRSYLHDLHLYSKPTEILYRLLKRLPYMLIWVVVRHANMEIELSLFCCQASSLWRK